MDDNPYQAPSADFESPQRDPGICPSCGGREFREGVVRAYSTTSLFVPDGWPYFRLRQGLKMKSLACVRCGNVREFIAQKDLDALRRAR